MTSRPVKILKGINRRRATRRPTSNVFAMFDQTQIGEFKEAFNLMDQNHDGFIDKEDLAEIMASLGKNPPDAALESMVAEAPGQINFTIFLTLFGERLQGTDPEDVIRNAFMAFDPENTGKIQEDLLKELLTTSGDRMTESDVDKMLNSAPVDKDGMFDYVQFTRILKHGTKDKD